MFDDSNLTLEQEIKYKLLIDLLYKDIKKNGGTCRIMNMSEVKKLIGL
jgi:hypothetical protein